MPQASTLKLSQPRIPTDPPAEYSPSAYSISAPARSFAMCSDRGRVRQGNEDACAAQPALGAFIVCDGMGGAAAGEVASHLAVQTFLDSLSASASRIPDPDLRSRLDHAIRDANDAVHRTAKSSRALQGMGTTLVTLFFEDTPPAAAGGEPTSGPALWLAHVGDSRCYRLRGGAFELLTRDHSIVEEQVRAGVITRTQVAVSPIRNIITRAVGSQPGVEPEIAALDPLPGDLYLLASDGLTRDLTDDEIARILLRTAVPPEPAAHPSVVQAALDSAARALIDAANREGGGDNITVLLVSCS
jgi:serine/threonine protein phosphatase PrpC